MLARLSKSVLPGSKRIIATRTTRSVGGIPYWAGPNESIPLVSAPEPVLPPDFPKDAVVPQLVDTLEWVLDSPPNVHQFEEPPIIVEIEHLKNLIQPDD